MLARKRGLEDVARQLLAAGATDMPSSSPMAGFRAWSAGTHAGPLNQLYVTENLLYLNLDCCKGSS